MAVMKHIDWLGRQIEVRESLLIIPQLRSHPDIGTIKARLGKTMRDAFANVFLVAVDGGAIEMLVASL